MRFRGRRCGVVLLAILAAAVAGRLNPAKATQRVAGLEVSATPGGPSAVLFRGRPTALWVRFSYEGATPAAVQIGLVSPTGLVLFRREAALDGPGSREWALEGAAVARYVAAASLVASEAARDNARRAATQSRGVAGYLAAATYASLQARSGLDVLAAVGLAGAARTRRLEAQAAAGRLRELLETAAALPPDDVAGRRALAEAMAAPAAEVVASTGGLVADLEGATGLRLPPTRSGVDERDAHTVVARVEGSVAQSLAVWIFDGRAFMPWLARQAVAR